MTSLIAIALLNFAPVADPTIDDVFQRNFKDASFVARIESSNQRELSKIKKEFGTQYRVKSSKFWIEDPHRMRVEAKVEDTTVLYVVNGAKRYYKIPRLGMTKTEDNERAPGKRQTFLDFGILTLSMFVDPFAAKFVRVDRATGDYVFDVTYRTPKYDDTSRHRIWVDPTKKFTTRREWYSQGGRQLATFYYENPVNKGGVWFPTRVTVKNVEGKVGGVTVYDDLTINAGIADSMFSIR